MKKNKHLFLILILVAFESVSAQVGIGTSNPSDSSVLDLSSTTQGLLIPRITTSMRNSMASPLPIGLLIYNTDEMAFNTYNGSNWSDFTTGYKSVSETAEVSTDLAIDTPIDGMSIIPGKGTYNVSFSGVFKNAAGLTYTTKSIADAANELVPLYNLLKGMPVSIDRSHPLATYGESETVLPGVYETATISISGTLILDAQDNPDAVFVFRSNGTIGTTAATVQLTNGAQACNVFWVAEGAVTIEGGTTIKGVILSHDGAVSVGAATNLEGRMFTTLGAIDFGGGYAHMPLTLSNTINIGSLAYFIMISGGGALSTAGVCDFSGGIATKVGAINVYGTSGGAIIYTPTATFQVASFGENNTNSIADFSVYQNGTLIPSSVRQVTANSGYKSFDFETIASVDAGKVIEVKWKKTTAKLQLGSRTLTLIKLK